MRASKWITGLNAEMNARQAAHRTLALRLAAVEQYLPLALQHAAESVEHVHQLRVATRRARAAIDLFQETLDHQAYRKLRQQLRRIRRAAGQARDADVFMGDVQARMVEARASEQPGLHWLAGEATAMRRKAQAELQALASTQPKRLQSATSEALTALAKSSHDAILLDAPMLQLSRTHLAALLKELHSLNQHELHDYEAVHEMRIAGKRLRYAIEILAGCFPPFLKLKVYPRVEAMQDHLGLVNDSHVAVERLDSIRSFARAFQRVSWKVWRPGLDALRRFHKKRMKQELHAFAAAWKLWTADQIDALASRMCTTPERTQTRGGMA